MGTVPFASADPPVPLNKHTQYSGTSIASVAKWAGDYQFGKSGAAIDKNVLEAVYLDSLKFRGRFQFSN